MINGMFRLCVTEELRSSNNQTNKYNKSSFIKVVVGKGLKVLNQLINFCRGYSIIV